MEEPFLRIGHKVAKTCSYENFFPENILVFIIYMTGTKEMTRNQCLEKGRKKQGTDNDSCHFSDHYFLLCLLCKYSTILFQHKNGIFQYKNQTDY